jgi:Tetratricopeptide repeat
MKVGQPILAAAGILASLANAAPTFHRDIAPIVNRYCAPCHRLGEAGPFPLLTYSDVKSHARQIADVTRRRYMPPWLPEPGHGVFQDELRLTANDIQTIADWVAAGSPEGDPKGDVVGRSAGTAAEGLLGPPNTWQLGEPDLILEAPHAYPLPSTGSDLYWNFIFTANIPAARWVRAIEIRPGDKRLVHHANLYVDRSRSARRQELVAGAGFGGMDPIIERPVYEPDDGHFLYWKPGGIPYNEPDGLAWQLEPGSDLVLNAHLQPSGKPEQVRPSIGLYFTDKPRNRYPMLVQLEHDGALNIPAGVSDFVVADDFKLPLDAYVLAIYPHAHNLGHVLEAYATPPSGQRESLIRIPAWDRNWESVYRYKEPVFLPKGTVISMRFHYGNSAANPRNPHDPPQRVRAGNKTSDEMGHLWLQILPADPKDHRLELQEALLRHTLEKYPNDFSALLHLGAVRMARFDTPGALTLLQAAARAYPANPEARNMLGSAYAAVGRGSDAIDQFRLAIKLRPDYQNARYNLARALMKAGKFDEAIPLLREVVAAFPDDAQAKSELDRALAHK